MKYADPHTTPILGTLCYIAAWLCVLPLAYSFYVMYELSRQDAEHSALVMSLAFVAGSVFAVLFFAGLGQVFALLGRTASASERTAEAVEAMAEMERRRNAGSSSMISAR